MPASSTPTSHIRNDVFKQHLSQSSPTYHANKKKTCTLKAGRQNVANHLAETLLVFGTFSDVSNVSLFEIPGS